MKTNFYLTLLLLAIYTNAKGVVLITADGRALENKRITTLNTDGIDIQNVTVDYKSDIVYLSTGFEYEILRTTHLVGVSPIKKIGQLPGATEIALTPGPFIVVYKFPSAASLDSGNVSVELRSRSRPQQMLASVADGFIMSDLVASCYYHETDIFLSRTQWYKYNNRLDQIEIAKKQAPEFSVMGCSTAGEIEYAETSKDGSGYKRTWTNKTAPGVRYSILNKFPGEKMRRLEIPTLVFLLDESCPKVGFGVSVFDMSIGEWRTAKPKTHHVSDRFKCIFFAGKSRDNRSAYFVEGRFTAKSQRAHGNRLFKLSKHGGEWLLEEFEPEWLTLQRKTEPSIRIQWVVE